MTNDELKSRYEEIRDTLNEFSSEMGIVVESFFVTYDRDSNFIHMVRIELTTGQRPRFLKQQDMWFTNSRRMISQIDDTLFDLTLMRSVLYSDAPNNVTEYGFGDDYHLRGVHINLAPSIIHTINL